MLSSVSVQWNVYWKHVRHSKRVAKFGFIWHEGFFCSLLWGSQIENHPQDLAKIGYKESFLCITKLSTCCQMRHFFSFFFPKIQENGKNKDGQNCKFIFLFQGFFKNIHQKRQTIEYNFLRILPSSSDR
jgi:hypothetical protein